LLSVAWDVFEIVFMRDVASNQIASILWRAVTVHSHGLCVHLYADDTQVYGFCRDDGSVILQSTVSTCVDDISAWMKSNRLQLNTTKTEVMWCASSRRMYQVPAVPLRIGADRITPVNSVRDLGVYLDSDLSVKTYISNCFELFRCPASDTECPKVAAPACTQLCHSLVLTNLDYCKSVLAGLPMNLLNKLQAVINSEARLVCYSNSKTAEHITPLLRDLHWLRIRERITFKLCVMAFKCQHNQAPAYLSDQLQQVSQVESRRRLRSSSTSSLVVPVTWRSMLGDRAFPVSAARAWNSLPSTVTAAPTLSSFRRALKTHLFTVSFPSWHTICRSSRLGSSITVLGDLAVFFL